MILRIITSKKFLSDSKESPQENGAVGFDMKTLRRAIPREVNRVYFKNRRGPARMGATKE